MDYYLFNWNALLCCTTVLFMFGLMGVCCDSFADFFIKDGSLELIILRIIAVGLGVYATLIFRKSKINVQ